MAEFRGSQKRSPSALGRGLPLQPTNPYTSIQYNFSEPRPNASSPCTKTHPTVDFSYGQQERASAFEDYLEAQREAKLSRSNRGRTWCHLIRKLSAKPVPLTTRSFPARDRTDPPIGEIIVVNGRIRLTLCHAARATRVSLHRPTWPRRECPRRQLSCLRSWSGTPSGARRSRN